MHLMFFLCYIDHFVRPWVIYPWTSSVDHHAFAITLLHLLSRQENMEAYVKHVWNDLDASNTFSPPQQGPDA